MLEVGNLASEAEDRTNFGAWCVVSSPLILSYDLADAALNARVMPIVTNKHAIAVNQRWAGHPGSLVPALLHIGVNRQMPQNHSDLSSQCF